VVDIDFIKQHGKYCVMYDIHGSPYHPMTQGKIERWHRSMKNVIKLRNYNSPSELESAIAEWVEYYNHERFHESLVKSPQLMFVLEKISR